MNPTLELVPATKLDVPAQRQLSAIDILDAAVRGGVTSENVAVVKEIMAMRREEMALANKAAFNRDFFALKQDVSRTDFYADKAAKTSGGQVAYTYCSETELAAVLEPMLFRHGFTMLFGQRQGEGQVVAVITLLHKDGHDETREFAVRSGNTNQMKDATAADTGATTSAWRHLIIKMFGIKSRIRQDDDPRNLGDITTKVAPERAFELDRRVKETNSNAAAFLKLAGANTFADIPAHKYDMLDGMLRKKEQHGK